MVRFRQPQAGSLLLPAPLWASRAARSSCSFFGDDSVPEAGRRKRVIGFHVFVLNARNDEPGFSIFNHAVWTPALMSCCVRARMNESAQTFRPTRRAPVQTDRNAGFSPPGQPATVKPWASSTPPLAAGRSCGINPALRVRIVPGQCVNAPPPAIASTRRLRQISLRYERSSDRRRRWGQRQ